MFAFHVRPSSLKNSTFFGGIFSFNFGCRLSTDTLLLPCPAQVEVLLDENQLMEEIGFLKRTLKTKRSLASLRAGLGLHCSPPESRKPYEHGSAKIGLLMDWVRTVSDFYDLKVGFEIRGRRQNSPGQPEPYFKTKCSRVNLQGSGLQRSRLLLLPLPSLAVSFAHGPAHLVLLLLFFI